MIVVILKEIMTQENRLCMTPAGIELMIRNGVKVGVKSLRVRWHYVGGFDF